MADEKLSELLRKERSFRGNPVSFPVDNGNLMSPKSIYASDRTTNNNVFQAEQYSALEMGDSFKSKSLKRNIGHTNKEIPFSSHAAASPSNKPTFSESPKILKAPKEHQVGQKTGKGKTWELPQNQLKYPTSLRKPVAKMFGLDASTVVDDDDDGSSSESDSLFASSPSVSDQDLSTISDGYYKRNLQKTQKEKDKKGSKKKGNNFRKEQRSERRRSVGGGDDTTDEKSVYITRSLSPVMPGLSDKKFLSKLKQREGRMTKEMKDMQNHLDVMSTNVEKALRKAGVSVKKEIIPDRKVPLSKKSLATTKTGSTPTVNKLIGKMPNEGPSKTLTDFLQSNGGLTGGWSHEDHSIFLKTFVKWKDRPVKMLEIVTKTIPHRSAQEVMAHVSWYDQWESLHKANQAYIRQWRINKRHQNEMVYKMGSLGQKANLEASRRRQDLLQSKREEEREKNKSRLSQWRAKSLNDKSDDTEPSYLGNFLKKYPNLNLRHQNRKKLEEEMISNELRFEEEDGDMIPPDSPRTKNLKSFTKKLKERSYSSKARTRFFSSNKAAIEKKEVGSSRIAAEEPAEIIEDFGHLPKIKDSLKKAASKKIIENFRSRDDKAVETRKKAIEAARNRLKRFETIEELQQRMKKNVVGVPSSVMQETKGWKIRRQIIKTEREKSENQKFEQSLPVSGGRRLQPVPFVTTISKLAPPNRRST